MPLMDSKGIIELTWLYAEFEGEHPSNLPNVNNYVHALLERYGSACMPLFGRYIPCWFSSFLLVEWHFAYVQSPLHVVLGLLALKHRNSRVDWRMKTQIIEALSLDTFQLDKHSSYPSLEQLLESWLINSPWRFGWSLLRIKFVVEILEKWFWQQSQ